MLPSHRLPRLRVSGTKIESAPIEDRFVIGIRGWAIIRQVSATGRQAMLTYKTRRGADQALAEVQRTYPQAEVYDRGENHVR